MVYVCHTCANLQVVIKGCTGNEVVPVLMENFASRFADVRVDCKAMCKAVITEFPTAASARLVCNWQLHNFKPGKRCNF